MKRKYEDRYKIVIRDGGSNILDTLYTNDLWSCLNRIFDDIGDEDYVSKSETVCHGTTVTSFSCFPYTTIAEVHGECIVKNRNMYVIGQLNKMVTDVRMKHIKSVNGLEKKVKVLAKVSKRNKNCLLKWLNRIAWCRVDADNRILGYSLNQIFDLINDADILCRFKADDWFGEAVIKGGK